MVVYEAQGLADGSMIKAAGTFSCESSIMCIYEQNIYTLEPGKIQVRTFQVRKTYSYILYSNFHKFELLSFKALITCLSFD